MSQSNIEQTMLGNFVQKYFCRSAPLKLECMKRRVGGASLTQILSISCGLHHKTPRLCLANIRQHHFWGGGLDFSRRGLVFSSKTCHQLAYSSLSSHTSSSPLSFCKGQDFKDSDQRTNIPFDCDSSKAGSVRDSTIFDISEHLKVRNFLFPFSNSPTQVEGGETGLAAERGRRRRWAAKLLFCPQSPILSPGRQLWRECALCGR